VTGARGAALLEVLVALALFSIAAVGSLERLAQLSHAEAQSEERERNFADADRLMAAMSLLTRSDLDLRLGRRVVGDMVVEVQRPRAVLYRVSIGRGEIPDLTTLLYRPGPSRAP
jgi:type II secretory pathway component PulK